MFETPAVVNGRNNGERLVSSRYTIYTDRQVAKMNIYSNMPTKIVAERR
jgi:hypothetical protein